MEQSSERTAAGVTDSQLITVSSRMSLDELPQAVSALAGLGRDSASVSITGNAARVVSAVTRLGDVVVSARITLGGLNPARGNPAN